ncbi:hypothetical protein FHS90_002394 [Rufibacter quisquiliarum]|uniref:Uncharacterized protein n=1 Tax=Rufibacter quisquiliarum TaxID=1549639 RepID=A0A839GS73_9BACT|nr:hypothetical protein [Rufibacter quisquiliarum]
MRSTCECLRQLRFGAVFLKTGQKQESPPEPNLAGIPVFGVSRENDYALAAALLGASFANLVALFWAFLGRLLPNEPLLIFPLLLLASPFPIVVLINW